MDDRALIARPRAADIPSMLRRILTLLKLSSTLLLAATGA